MNYFLESFIQCRDLYLLIKLLYFIMQLFIRVCEWFALWVLPLPQRTLKMSLYSLTITAPLAFIQLNAAICRLQLCKLQMSSNSTDIRHMNNRHVTTDARFYKLKRYLWRSLISIVWTHLDKITALIEWIDFDHFNTCLPLMGLIHFFMRLFKPSKCRVLNILFAHESNYLSPQDLAAFTLWDWSLIF